MRKSLLGNIVIDFARQWVGIIVCQEEDRGCIKFGDQILQSRELKVKWLNIDIDNPFKLYPTWFFRDELMRDKANEGIWYIERIKNV